MKDTTSHPSSSLLSRRFGRRWARLAAAGLSCATALLLAPSAKSADVLTQHNDQFRSGANLTESVLTPANVTVSKFGKLFSYAVDGSVYAQPLSVSNLSIGGGTHNVVYVATMEDSVYAFDADKNTTYWHVSFTGGTITPVPITDITFNNNLNIHGNVGIVSTPVIDRSTSTIYVLARTKDTSNGTYIQKLHALDLATGAEKLGGPVTINASGFNSKMQNQRPGLVLANGNIYIAWGSHEDFGPYHGWLMAYNASTLAQVAVLNLTDGGNMGAVWQSGQGPAVDAQGNLYMMTGNGDWNGTTRFGSSFIKVSPSLQVVDYFTPANFASENASDADLGCGGALLLPSGTGYPSTQYVIGGGKEGRVFVLDKNNGMGHMTSNDQGAHQIWQGIQTNSCSHHIHGSPIFWNSPTLGQLIYIWGENDVAKAFSFNGSTFNTTPVLTTSVKSPEIGCGMPGGILSLSADGGSNGILWANCIFSGDALHNTVPGILRAFDANNLGKELWNSRQNQSRDDIGNYAKFVPPTVANGKVYMATFSNAVNVYGLLDTSSTVSVTGVTVAPTSAAINVGSTTSLTATVAPANATNTAVTWTSSNPAVASVNGSGLVTGVAAGSATITAKTQDGGFSAASSVTVSNVNVATTGVTVAPASTSLTVGATATLTASVLPANASNKTVSWSSNNTAVATVNGSGVVTGVAAGTATITVTTQSGGFTASAAITVTSNTVPTTGVAVTPTSASVNVGATTSLVATVAPSNATNKSVTWSSSNPSIATVNGAGVVTGVAAGSATITATTANGGFTASSTITVVGGGNTGTPCANPTNAALPLTQNGVGDVCFVSSGTVSFVNSWNMQLVEINGVDFTNKWANSLPARINGNYYFHYVATVPWAHFEVNGTSSGGTNTVAVTGVAVTPATASIATGGSVSLSAAVAPATASNKTVAWTSSNTSVATVNASGSVTGVAAGSATITAKTQDGGFTSSAAVTVTNLNIPVTDVSVSPTTASVAAGSTTTLSALVSPANATNKTVTWSSSAPAVATVNSAGVVTGVTAGTATITATAQGGVTATSTVTVTGGGNTGGAACTGGTAITLPFAQNGASDSCFIVSGNVAFLNSWNMQLVEINGVDYTNKWANSLPPRINGNYYIHYVATVPWAHLEITGQ